VLGFALDYNRSDSTFVTLRWAEQLHAAGVEASVFTFEFSHRLGSRWDDSVSRMSVNCYRDWLKSCQTVVFCQPPSTSYLQHAKALGTKTRLLLCWGDLQQSSLHSLSLFDAVICPFRVAEREMLDSDRLNRPSFLVPWDLVADTVRGESFVDDDRVGLVLDLDGSQSAHCRDFVGHIQGLLATPAVYLTIFYGEHLSPALRSKLDALRMSSEGRIETVGNASLDTKISLAASHDLLLWPSSDDSIGLPGLIASSAGIPCIAYDHPIAGELIRHEKNGILVPCDLHFSSAGAPGATPNSKLFLKHVADVVNNTQLLESMRDEAFQSSQNRRALFIRSSQNVFPS
jgi:glycosyltransferase involved in cell wall biosynthesis